MSLPFSLPLSKYEQGWLLGLTGSLTLSLILVSWIGRPNLCFESEVISQIRVVRQAQIHSVYRCRSQQRVPYDPESSDLVEKLGPRLQLLDHQGRFLFGEGWQDLAMTLVVRDLESPTTAQETFPHEIQMTLAESLQPRRLEREIMSAELDQLVPSTSNAWPARDLLQTFVFSILNDQPEEGTLATSADWKMALYHQAIQKARGELPVGEQFQILHAWIEALNKSSDPNRNWMIPDGLKLPLSDALAGLGYRQDQQILQIPFAVDVSDVELNLNTRQLREFHQQLAVVIDKEKIWLPFSTQAFSRLNALPLQVGRLVLVRCGLPEISEIDRLAIRFEHVLIVQSCQKPDVAMLISALQSPKYFAKDYPKVDFIQIHWPSLQLAMDKAGVKANSLLSLFSAEVMSHFRRSGFFVRFDQDRSSGTSEWKGALEPLPLFRLKDLPKQPL